MRKSNGEGTIWTEIRNGKNYYRSSVVIGKDCDGKLLRKTFGSFTKSTVVNKMQKALYEYKNNILTLGDNILFGNFFKEWIFNFKKREVSANTFSEYEICFRLKILPYQLSQIKIKDLNAQNLQKYFNHLLDVEKLSINNVKKVHIKIKACLQFALIQNVVLRNPILAITLPKIKTEEKYKVFSKEEQELILSNLTDNILDKIIYIGFFTGLRLGEVLGLKWEDLEGNTLKIRRQYQKNIEVSEVGKKKLSYVFKELKTDKSKRDLPLTQNVLDMLLKMKEHQYSDLIFANYLGKPIERKRPTRKINKICKDLGILERSYHAVRHTYATRLFELDIPVKTVQVLLGHSEVATTLDIYTHVMEDKKIEAIEKLNNLFK